MQQWEYTCIVSKPADFLQVRVGLEKLGSDGWELVAIVPEQGEAKEYTGYWLKRPKA